MVACVKVLDELLPRETGRERRIEKKKMRYEAQKEREVSPGEATRTRMQLYILMCDDGSVRH